MLSDQTLFGSSGDLTTKDILKKFSDRAANGLGPRGVADVAEIVGRHEMASRPPPRRMESDPTSWQQESSARPVQDPSIPFGGPPAQGAPPPKRGPYDAPPQQPPYGQFDQAGAQDNNGRNQQQQQQQQHHHHQDQQQQREWRNSGWGRQNSGLTTGTV